jgi:hypothetical protein
MSPGSTSEKGRHTRRQLRRCAVLLVAALLLPAAAWSQSAADRLAVIQGVATAVSGQPGGPFLVGGDGALSGVLAASLKTRRARAGEMPNCGGLVGRLGTAPISQSGGYVIVLRAPEFSGDEAAVGVAFLCMNTMGGRRGSAAKNETFVFQRGANGWALARRSKGG